MREQADEPVDAALPGGAGGERTRLSCMARLSRLRSGRLLASAAMVVLVAVLAACGPYGSGGAPRGARQPRPRSLIVSTSDGTLAGKHAEGVAQFLGVPYAAPPTGKLRWQAPRPARPWRGIREATAYGSECPQSASSSGPQQDTESCLFLNVFMPAGQEPAPGTGTRAAGLPVLLMIHGGGLATGGGDLVDGSLLARTGDIVVVSVNYRLGVLGFLNVPGLSGTALAAHGNFGLLDQEAALRWVHSNVARFGGDPGQVTIAGESAGGWSVCALMSSPPARGLFSRAIMESGSCPSRSPSDAQAAGLAFARHAGCGHGATAAACLRRTPASALVSASTGYGPQFTSGGPDLPVPPATAVAAGLYTRVPLLIGTNHDEGRTFAQGYASLTRGGYVGFVDRSYGALAPAILRRYPWGAFPAPYTAAYAIGAIWTDSGRFAGIGGCPAQRLAAQFARATPTFFYQFDDRHAPALAPDPPGYQWGAAHTSELAYLFPGSGAFTPIEPLTAPQQELSRQMAAWWATFTSNGTPRAPGQPPWPPYASRVLMSLRPGDRSHTLSAAAFGAEHQCAFWDAPGR
jgi:carboxylesterase type B